MSIGVTIYRLSIYQACGGLAAQLATRLVVGCTVGDIGVADCARALRAVLIELTVWFKKFLALYYLAYALIY